MRKNFAVTLNAMPLALDGERVYVWDTERGSLLAISRTKREILWELVVDLERLPGLLPVSPTQVEGNLIDLTDNQGNRVLVIDARDGLLIESR